MLRRMSSRASGGLRYSADIALDAATGVAPKRGMVLPFTPLTMSFDDVNYFVDMPPVCTSSTRYQKHIEDVDLNLFFFKYSHF